MKFLYQIQIDVRPPGLIRKFHLNPPAIRSKRVIENERSGAVRDHFQNTLLVFTNLLP